MQKRNTVINGKEVKTVHTLNYSKGYRVFRSRVATMLKYFIIQVRWTVAMAIKGSFTNSFLKLQREQKAYLALQKRTLFSLETALMRKYRKILLVTLKFAKKFIKKAKFLSFSINFTYPELLQSLLRHEMLNKITNLFIKVSQFTLTCLHTAS